MMTNCLIDGVLVRDLVSHSDARGTLRELYRADWVPVDPFLQWNLVTSEVGTLRGVHVHPKHCDYLHVISGQMLLGLHDLRPDDPGERRTQMVTLTGDLPQTAFIPPGVCHGFQFPMRTTYVYGLSTGWSKGEELGCRYDEPALGMAWPDGIPVLSPRDESPDMSYDQMRVAWLSRARHIATA